MAWQHIEEAVLAWISKNPEIWDDSEYVSEDRQHGRLRDSVHSGASRVEELLNGHPRRFLELLMLNKDAFKCLVGKLRQLG